MNVELKLSTDNDAHIIRNLWPLYQHDVSAFDGTIPNRHGIFSDDETMASLAQYLNSLGPWWRDPESLFPYLILVDGYPAGFNLIAAQPRLPQGIRADFVVHEFFILHAYRGSSAAERAAIQGFDRHRGKWEVVTYPKHLRAIAFWSRVISHYTLKKFSESEIDHPWGRRISFRFVNTKGIHKL